MPTAEELLGRLLAAGFSLGVDVLGALRVSPSSSLTDELRGEICLHRDALIALIERPTDDRRRCTECSAFDGYYCGRPGLSGFNEPGVVSRMLQRCPGFKPRT